MIITYFGKQFFKIQQGETVIALNPISKQSKTVAKPARFGSQIVLSSIHHPDFNGIEQVTYADQVPMVIDGPGDYEVKEIFIKGVGIKTTVEKKEYINTVYSFSVEDISLLTLGALSQTLPASERQDIDAPDILFVPLGGDALDPKDAYKLAVSFEPSVIIPMDYDEKSLSVFLKEAGISKKEEVDKLVIKKKELLAMQSEVVLLANVQE